MKLSLRAILMLATLAALPSALVRAAETPNRPRLLVLPWLVIDRTTNLECGRTETAPTLAVREARSLASAAQAALDAEMHDHRTYEMIPRREWEPLWTSFEPGQLYHVGPDCAACTPVRKLLHYDSSMLLTLAQATRADYVWLGASVAPLTSERKAPRADECCRAALGQGRDAVLARSSALLVRVRDGAVVWQQDARRLERDVPIRAGRLNRPAAVRRTNAVADTAHLLGAAFRRDHPRGSQ